VNLYGQEAEVRLLAQSLSKLSGRIVIDVGAERGDFTQAMLAAGADHIHAFEPAPRNIEFLRERFRDDSRVTIHTCAIAAEDGELELRVPADLPQPTRMAGPDTFCVSARSLASLVAAAEIPGSVGILRIDADERELGIIEALGDLVCDVLITAFRFDMPDGRGPCPWTAIEIGGALAPRDFNHFAYFVHRDDYTVVQWDDGHTPAGAGGNLVFVSDRVLSDLVPYVLMSASALAGEVVDVAERRLATLYDVDREREVQATAADERLAMIRTLDREREVQEAAAGERLAVIEALDREREEQATADERLAMIEQATAADERLTETARGRVGRSSWRRRLADPRNGS
jgi:FkbM family methyltransferase